MKTAHAFHSSASVKALVVGIAGLCCALAAQAGDAVAPGTVRTQVPVSFDDLNLASPAGARTFYARLKSASERACGNRPSGRDSQEFVNYQTCYESALDKAVRKIDNGQLQALHRNSAESSTG